MGSILHGLRFCVNSDFARPHVRTACKGVGRGWVPIVEAPLARLREGRRSARSIVDPLQGGPEVIRSRADPLQMTHGLYAFL